MNIKFNLSIPLLLSLTLVACGSSDKKKSEPVKEPEPVVAEITGIWNAAAYGWVINIQEDSYDFYETTRNYCQKFANDDEGLTFDALINSIDVNEDKLSLTTTLAGWKVPSVKMIKQQNLPEHCINDLVLQAGDENYDFDPQQDFEIFWQTFKEHYAFFDIENVDWDEVYQLANSEIHATTSESELFGILSTMISPLKDFHVVLKNEALDLNFGISRKKELSDIALADFITINNIKIPLSEEIREQFSDYYEQEIDNALNIIANDLFDDFDIRSNDTETFMWGKTEENFGYLYIASMDLYKITGDESSLENAKGKLTQTLDNIMHDFKDVDGVILDLRFNEGGNDFVSTMIFSRFINKDFHAYSKQARLVNDRTPLQKVVVSPDGENQFIGPVAVLTSPTTSSSAEVFAISMRERDNTILIGEATGGGLSDSLPKTLPHGLEFSLSNEFYMTPKGELFEGVGVPVGIEQKFFTLEQREAEEDYGLDKAILWLLEKN
jgi:carboxyl-terminal processing protease